MSAQRYQEALRKALDEAYSDGVGCRVPFYSMPYPQESTTAVDEAVVEFVVEVNERIVGINDGTLTEAERRTFETVARELLGGKHEQTIG